MINLADIKMKPSNFGGNNEPEQLFGLAAQLTSKGIQHGVWQSGPGELTLKFEWTETVYIVEGSAEVKNLITEEKFILTVGSMMSFEQGSHWRWRIPWKLKKIFTIVE